MSRPFDPFDTALTGIQLVEASAGTGKTYSLTTLFLRFLLEAEQRVDQILTVTFTEAATAELHGRIRARLAQAWHAFVHGAPDHDPVLEELLTRVPDHDRARFLLQQALANIDQAAVSTIHGFCHRVLQQGAFEGGVPFEMELVDDVDELLGEVVDDFVALTWHRQDPRLVSLARRGLGRTQLLDLARLAARHRQYPAVVGKAAARFPAPDPASLIQRYQKARSLWRRAGEELTELLADQPGICASFRRLLASGLLERLDRYLRPAEPAGFDPPSGSDCLTDRQLEEPGKVFTATGLKKGAKVVHPFFAAWQSYLEGVELLARQCQGTFLQGLVAFLRQELPERLARQRLLGFDDLLYLLDQALSRPGGGRLARLIRDRFPVALVDEFQDTDPVQYRIFSAIYGPARERTALYLIGDPKQAIYSFRGADIYAYLQAAEDAGAAVHTMTVNWRADQAMVTSLNRLFAVERPFWDERIHFPPVSAAPGATDRFQGGGAGDQPLQFLLLPDRLADGRQGTIPAQQLDQLIPVLVAADLSRLLGEATLNGHPLRPGEVAVLVRSNAQAETMRQALLAAGIQATLHSRASVYQSHEAAELLLLLRGVVEHTDDRAVRAALATDYLQYSAQRLKELENQEAAWQAELERFGGWRLLWERHGLMRMVRQLSEESGLAEQLLAFADGERRLTNFRHLVELLHGAEKERHLRPRGLVKWLGEQGRKSVTASEAELRLESDDEAVQVVTIHKSKGLEFPVVYCPYLWKGVAPKRGELFFSYHEPAACWQGRIGLLPDENQQQLRRQERFAEELRVVYVALTRAKHCCLVPWAKGNGYPHSGLAYLLHAGAAPAGVRQDLAVWSSYLARLPQSELAKQVRERAIASPGWLVRELDPERPPLRQPRPAGNDAGPFHCRRPSRSFRDARRQASFSQLIAGSRFLATPEAEKDWDAFAAPVEPAARPQADQPLAAFPRGTRAGNFFHTLLESLSFPGLARGGDREAIARHLVAYGFDQQWLEPVASALEAVLATPLLPDSPLRLADIGDRQRLNELGFVFPVAMDDSAVRLTTSRLARVFEAAGQEPLRRYADQVRRLPFSPLAGYLKGFIDLVFVWQGQWFLADYKSNHLGDRLTDYGGERLLEVMGEHHYFLQYHLYALALHRYLGHRLADYRYQRHFGGVFYLFLRGMRPAAGPRYGVYFDRPSLATIEALSRIMEGD